MGGKHRDPPTERRLRSRFTNSIPLIRGMLWSVMSISNTPGLQVSSESASSPSLTIAILWPSAFRANEMENATERSSSARRMLRGDGGLM
jgi:hypothetical protein